MEQKEIQTLDELRAGIVAFLPDEPPGVLEREVVDAFAGRYFNELAVSDCLRQLWKESFILYSFTDRRYMKNRRARFFWESKL